MWTDATGITAGDLILIEEELITVGTISSNTLGTGGGPSTRGVAQQQLHTQIIHL